MKRGIFPRQESSRSCLIYPFVRCRHMKRYRLLLRGTFFCLPLPIFPSKPQHMQKPIEIELRHRKSETGRKKERLRVEKSSAAEKEEPPLAQEYRVQQQREPEPHRAQVLSGIPKKPSFFSFKTNYKDKFQTQAQKTQFRRYQTFRPFQTRKNV